jgi:hypothetical protein
MDRIGVEQRTASGSDTPPLLDPGMEGEQLELFPEWARRRWPAIASVLDELRAGDVDGAT